MIHLKNVSKIFNKDGKDIFALKNVSLNIDKGEFVSIIGPSGSGKTTLLFTLSGLMQPTDGEVVINNLLINKLSNNKLAQLRAEMFGFVFQLFYLIPYLTALENVLLPFISKPENNRPDMRNNALEMLKKLNLDERINHKPEELSVGERQRVALARALFSVPDIILADEPTGNIDKENAQIVMEFLTEFQKRGKTVIFVTHNEQETRCASKIYKLRNGILQ